MPANTSGKLTTVGDLIYLNYFVSSNNVGLAKYPENRIQTYNHSGHSRAIPPKFFVPLQILLRPENFLIKITYIIKTEVLTV